MSEQNNIYNLKKLAAKMKGGATTPEQIEGETIADVIDIIQTLYSSGGGGGLSISEVVLNMDGNALCDNGHILYSDGSRLPFKMLTLPQTLSVVSVPGTTLRHTKLTVTPTLSEGNEYKYKTGSVVIPAPEQDLSSWNDWDGVSELMVDNGTNVTLVECNAGTHTAVSYAQFKANSLDE